MSKITTLNEYQQATSETAIFPKEKALEYTALGAASEIGECCSIAKKAIRDNNGVLSEEKKQDLKKEIGDVLWYVAQLAAAIDVSLEDVAQTNINKLFSRKERGVIGGSGDNR